MLKILKELRIFVLPLSGTIVQKEGIITKYLGGTSTETFGYWVDTFSNDTSVSRIIIDVNSGGGSVYGVKELSDKIYEARKNKPIIAVVNSLMASAAYWIGSAADKIYVTPSGEAGSNKRVQAQQRREQPVISVDTKKKELVGDFKNKGQEWHPQGNPEKVRVHDFIDKELGKVAPYGVYDLTKNNGWVSVGIDHDTAAFAVAAIRRWWRKMGHPAYSKASHLLITADSGGSNSSRSRLWKVELQKMANQTGLTITVCHFPPGTSKWNKIEHRMFSFITQNWRGKPLTDRATIVNLIGSTKTKEGLKIRCELDTKIIQKESKYQMPNWKK